MVLKVHKPLHDHQKCYRSDRLFKVYFTPKPLLNAEDTENLRASEQMLIPYAKFQTNEPNPVVKQNIETLTNICESVNKQEKFSIQRIWLIFNCFKKECAQRKLSAKLQTLIQIYGLSLLNIHLHSDEIIQFLEGWIPQDGSDKAPHKLYNLPFLMPQPKNQLICPYFSYSHKQKVYTFERCGTIYSNAKENELAYFLQSSVSWTLKTGQKKVVNRVNYELKMKLERHEEAYGYANPQWGPIICENSELRDKILKWSKQMPPLALYDKRGEICATRFVVCPNCNCPVSHEFCVSHSQYHHYSKCVKKTFYCLSCAYGKNGIGMRRNVKITIDRREDYGRELGVVHICDLGVPRNEERMDPCDHYNEHNVLPKNEQYVMLKERVDYLRKCLFQHSDELSQCGILFGIKSSSGRSFEIQLGSHFSQELEFPLPYTCMGCRER